MYESATGVFLRCAVASLSSGIVVIFGFAWLLRRRHASEMDDGMGHGRAQEGCLLLLLLFLFVRSSTFALKRIFKKSARGKTAVFTVFTLRFTSIGPLYHLCRGL